MSYFRLKQESYKRPTPTRPRPKKTSRTVKRTKSQTIAEIKKAVKWNIATLEFCTTGCDTVHRSLVISMLKLDKISPKVDPTGKHTMQMIISEGYVMPSYKQYGIEVFDRADVLRGLKSFAGVASL